MTHQLNSKLAAGRSGIGMTGSTSEITHDAITRVIGQYVSGARSGRGDDMRPAFHEDATVFGYVGDDLFAGPIEQLFAWNDANGPAAALEARIASIDVQGTVATVRLELDQWTGQRFTDLFTLLNVDGQWRIMNKVFHRHSAET